MSSQEILSAINALGARLALIEDRLGIQGKFF